MQYLQVSISMYFNLYIFPETLGLQISRPMGVHMLSHEEALNFKKPYPESKAKHHRVSRNRR